MVNARQLRIVAQPAFTRRELNPYTWELSTSLQAAGMQVDEFSRDEVLRGGHDIWHLHWPDAEAQFARGNLQLIVRRSVRLLMLLHSARSRGTRVIWTVHNLHSHEQRFPRLEGWFWRMFLRQVDGAISLSNSCVEPAIERFPRLARLPLFVVPLGHFRDSYPNTITRAEARLALGVDQDARVLSFVGQIREYKNLPELITLVRALGDPTVTLLVAGPTTSPSLDERLKAAAAADPRVRLHLRLIPEHEIQLFLNAADVVVLPYREVLNSAAALLALSFNKPVLLPEIGALPELQERVGPAWVRLYRGALTTDILHDALSWARNTQRPAEAPLDPYDWAEVARATIAAYHCVLAGRNPPRQQPSVPLATVNQP
jgi:glycosyltransferase involved in cell wall biosynthesis